MLRRETQADLLAHPYSARILKASAPAVVIFLLMLSGAGAAIGDDYAFPQHLVNDEAIGEEFRYDPAAIPLSDGNTLLLWVDNTRGRADIVSRIVDAELTGLGEPVRIIDEDGFWSQTDVIASSPNGGRAVAVWFDSRSGRTLPDLYAQLFSTEDGRPVGPNLPLSTDPAQGVQEGPDAAVNSSGRTLIVWMDNRTGLYRIWGRFVEPDGSVIGDDLPLAPETPQSIQRFPGIAALPDGRWLLAYEVLTGGVYQVFYRILEPDGRALEAETIAESTGYPQEEPAVITRSQDALIAWIDNRDGTSDLWGLWVDHLGDPYGSPVLLRENTDTARDIGPRLYLGADDVIAMSWLGAVQLRQRTMMRFFGPDRAPLTGDLVMNDPASDVLSRQGTVVQRAAGDWLLAWSDNRTLTYQIYLDTAQLPQGPTGSEIRAYSSPGSASQFLPDVALFPDRRGVVVWADIRSGSLNIFCRFLDDKGQPEGSSFLVNAVPALRRIGAIDDVLRMSRYAPSVAASDSTFVVTWAVDTGGPIELYGQLYDLEGQPIGGNFPVVAPDSPGWPQAEPAPAMSPDGRFGIAWRDNRFDSGGDIFLQMFGRSGERLGPNLPVVTPGGPRSRPQQSPTLSISGSDVMVAWSDRRSVAWDIWRQRLPLNNPESTPISNEILHEPSNVSHTEHLYPSTATSGGAVVTVWEFRPLASGRINGRLEFFPSKDGPVQDDAPVNFTVNPDDGVTGFKRPRVAMDQTGRFIVTWWDVREGRTAIRAQRYDRRGNPIEGPYELDEQTAGGYRAFPRLAVDQGIIQYVWTDSRRGLGWDVYARRVDWDYNGTPVPVMLNYFFAEAAQDGPRITWSVSSDVTGLQFRLWRDLAYSGEPDPVPSGEAVLVTPHPVQPVDEGRFELLDRDAPSGLPLLYYLEVIHPSEPPGFLGPVAVEWETPLAGMRWRLSPNPFRERLDLYPPAAGPLLLEIWDVTGRKVRRIAATPAPGEPVTWDGMDESGRQVPAGIYFVRAGRPAAAADPAGRDNPAVRAERRAPVQGGTAFKVLRVR